jgi:hypothetical protein
LPPKSLYRGDNLQFFIDQGTLNTPAQELVPQRVGLVVIQHHRSHDQFSRHPKFVLGYLNLSGIYNARKTEGSPGDRKGFTANCIVHDLVAGHQFERIGPVIAVDRKSNHPFVWVHLTKSSDLVTKLRLQDGRNPVSAQYVDYLQVQRSV